MDTLKKTGSEPVDANKTAGSNLPFWFAQADATSYQPLTKSANADVLVVGGGIAGLTAAYCLAKEGLHVILVEDGDIGSGESGRTTAHLTCALDDRYFEIEKMFGKEGARLAAESHVQAIDWIEQFITSRHIDCRFKRVDGYLFLHPSDEKESLNKEFEATQRAGLPTQMMITVPGIAAEEGRGCIRFPNQAQFHIMLYLQGLAKEFISLGGEIYTRTRAENINTSGAVANGYEIKAKHVVVATNTPVNDWVTMHTKQWPYRTYVIGAKIPKGKLASALWWDTGDHDSKWICDPYHYIRLEELNETHDLLISGGEDHRTGQADDEHVNEEDRYNQLIHWAKRHFPDMEEVIYKWSGQVLEPIDSMAYIGKNPGDDNIYIITGDSGNGMTHGTLGGMIITDLILERANPWADLYDPSRVNLSTSSSYLKEVANMVAQYGDWFSGGDVDKAEDLKPGQGAIVTSGFRKTAVYCDEHRKLHTCSAVCPHLGAILQWNADEKTFDCPMHGSRFTTEGKVINGPATSDLKKIG